MHNDRISPTTKDLLETPEKESTSKNKYDRCFWASAFIVLGALLTGAIISTVFILKDSVSCSTTPPPPWNASDYESNSEYYGKLSTAHDFTQIDNLRLDRLSSPQFHPDHGKIVMYLRQQYHMPDLNGSTITLHTIDLATNKTVQLTRPIWGVYDQQFFWIDNKTVLFLSNRGATGLTQLFQLNLPDNVSTLTDFIEPVQITNYPLDIDNLLVNSKATRIAFSCQVYANLSIDETAARIAYDKGLGSLVYTFDKLFIRHWDQFMLGRRNHPFIASISRNNQGTFNLTSTPIDLLFGIDSDSPTRPFGSAIPQWSFSASGDRFAFTRQHDETSAVAWSTNLDIYMVDLSQSHNDLVCLTCENQAADTDPLFSPTNENILVYRAQSVPGYESDQFKIKLWNGSKIVTILNDWDLSTLAMTWSRDGNSLFLEIGEKARNVIYQLFDVTTTTEPKFMKLLNDGSSHAINVHPTINDHFVFTHESLTEPANIYVFESMTSFRPITFHNSNWTAKVRLSHDVEIFTFEGSLNENVSGWHMAPVNGRANKAPLAFLIHGGPQNSWYDAWSYRWNYQAYAGQGYGVIAINFHGSDSYGQNFTNSITGNYGTYPFEDLESGLTYALKSYDYLDGQRAAALGASYGGYMINWIAGHPEMSQRFKTLICHDGLFDLRGMAYSTEELWFSEHDVGNFTPYGNPEAFEKYNPVNHVANWTQPMLIIHGGRDYRVPDTQGISAFTALQRRGIKSRLLYLPNENHWTLNPFNSLKWYDEVLTWMGRCLNSSC